MLRNNLFFLKEIGVSLLILFWISGIFSIYFYFLAIKFSFLRSDYYISWLFFISIFFFFFIWFYSKIFFCIIKSFILFQFFKNTLSNLGPPIFWQVILPDNLIGIKKQCFTFLSLKSNLRCLYRIIAFWYIQKSTGWNGLIYYFRIYFSISFIRCLFLWN